MLAVVTMMNVVMTVQLSINSVEGRHRRFCELKRWNWGCRVFIIIGMV